MKIINFIKHINFLYIYFLFLSLNIFFFSTTYLKANSFDIKNIEISEPFEINFNKNTVFDKGFKKAFFELGSLIINSSDIEKIDDIKLNEIKGMIESFSIKEEKFIDEIYHLNLGVSFNKKKIFNFLEKRNIFPSVPQKKTFLFIPIIIDENKKDLLIFSNNQFFKNWNLNKESYHLIEYILPTEDLEDLDIIKSKFDSIEQYEFKEIINKYFLKDSIITLIFKNQEKIRVLSRITINEKVNLKNQSFSNKDINNEEQTNEIIANLKTIYEDYWKNSNQINTSIKLQINIKMNSLDNSKILEFEKSLKNIDLVSNYFIYKFNKNFNFYKVIFNGTPQNFLKSMSEKKYNFDTQNKIWILK